MSYVGETLELPCNRGGFTYDPNPDAISPFMMVTPSRNIDLHENGRGKRGGTAHVNTTVISGTPEITALHDFRLPGGSQFLMMLGSDGKLYKNFTTAIKTGLTADTVGNFVVYKENVYLVNGVDIPQVWDGAAGSSADISNPAASWSASNYPKQMIVHGRGASLRLWAIGAASDPYTIDITGNGTDSFTTQNVTLLIETGDDDGIVGLVEMGDRVIAFGKRQSYIIDDSDIDTTNWGYAQAQWSGGVAHHRLIVKTPNDLICMTDDGDIYSVRTAEQYGDYQAGSVARPAFIDRWLRDQTDLTQISKFHAIYDSTQRAVCFFVVRAGQTSVDTTLVYYIDRPIEEAWTIHDNTDNVSGYSASCSTLYKVADGNWRVYTGGYSGFVWRLGEATTSDNGLGYYAGFTTPWLSAGQPRLTKHFKRGLGVVEAEGDYHLETRFKVDDSSYQGDDLDLSGTGGVLGSFILGTDALGGNDVKDVGFKIGKQGKRLQMEFRNSHAGENFFVSQLFVDAKPLGKRNL